MLMKPNLNQEKKLWKKGYELVVGLDEAGRGALAGSVVAAAVMVINSKFKMKNEKLQFKIRELLSEVKDSKQLNPLKREEVYKKIIKCPYIIFGVGKVGERIIDKINIKNAAELAMERALKSLEKKIKKRTDFLLIDGNNIKNSQLKTYNSKLIVRADEKVFSCAAASIIAKVTRDRIMKKLDKRYPQYGFKKHKGYGTKLHFKMIKKYGFCKIHRFSYLKEDEL